MSRAPVSPLRDSGSSFLPPPIQRLSRSFSSAPAHSPSSDRHTVLPSPNRVSASQPSSSRHSNIFPRLHRLEIADDTPTSREKTPLLELKLSSTSFLDAVASDTESEKSLYAVETVGPSTTVWRSDPLEGSAKIADIRWPKDVPVKAKARDHAQGAMIQMDDLRWRCTTSLLKCCSLGSSRKFHVPYHPHALKWKREGDVYVCTTSTSRGAVATLDSFNSTDTAPRLRVFETLDSFHQSVPQFDHAGISLFLLDHLFVTALLLVTEPEDWMILSRNPSSLDGRSSHVPASFRTASCSRASDRQWRKIMYGEPLYPSLKTTTALDTCTVNGGEDADVLDISISEPSRLSASTRQWRKIVYGEPLYPSLRPQSANGIDLPPRPCTATSFSSDSAYSHTTPSSAPSTRFHVPSPFDVTDRTAPRSGIETSCVTSPLPISSSTLSPMPSSECIRLSPRIPTPPGARRELPSPPSSYQPPPSVQPWLNRLRSSPKLSDTAQLPTSPTIDDEDDLTNLSLLTRIATPMNVRQLPTPPQRESAAQSPQAQTQMRPVETRRLSQTYQRSLPPTPASVSRSSSTQPYHTHSPSQEVPSRSLPSTSTSRPLVDGPGPSIAPTTVQNNGAAGGRRGRQGKDPDEVISWMRNITRAHRRRAFEGDDDQLSGPDDSTYEAPPAYNAIDFSTPPQARSPQGTQG